MTIKVIATDMDGTLLDARGQLDLPRLEKILDQLDQRGIRFVIATGNEIHRMRQLLEHLVDRVVLVVANGARIFENNELIQAQTWDDNIVDKALAHFEARACQDQFVVTGMKGGFVKEGTIFTDLESFMTPEMIEKFYQRMHFVDELTSDLFGGVLKMSMVVGEERLSSVLEEINDLFDGHVRAVSSGYGCIDILQAGIHKAWGLEELLKRWDLNPQQIMAFGDSENDVEMLEMAGIAYAMENADDKAKAVATALAPANSQGGVYQVLENWLEKGEWSGSTVIRKLVTKGTRQNPNQVPSLKSGFCCRTRHSFYWGFHCRILSSAGVVWDFKDDCQSRHSRLSDRAVIRKSRCPSVRWSGG